MQRNLKTLLAATAISLIGSSGLVNADILFNHEPGSPVSLGRSIDFRLPTETKKDCLENRDTEWVETGVAVDGEAPGVFRVKVSGEYTDSYEELISKLFLNASFKANATVKGFTIKGDDKLELDYEFVGKYSDLYYVLVAWYDFGSRRLQSAKLAAEFQELLDAGKHDEFVAQCGTHFAVSEERWAFASIIVNIDRLDESVKRRLKFTHEGKVEVVKTGSANLGLGIEKIVNTARRYGAATLDFEANGGDPTKAGALAQAAQSNDLAASLTAMETYMSSIARSTSVPRTYRLASFGIFGLEVDEDPSVVKFMEDMYFAGVKYQGAISDARDRINDLNESGNENLNLRQVYENDIQKLAVEKAALDQLAIACVRDGECDREKIAEAAPLIGYRTTLLRAPQIKTSCLYHEDILAAISVKLSGSFVDPNAVQDIKVYRISDQNPSEWELVPNTRTALNADPDGNRFVSRLEIVDAEQTGEVPLRQFVRTARYEMSVGVVDGSREWYDLGFPAVIDDRCPLTK